MVHLPNEIMHQIIRDCLEFGNRRCLKDLSAINRNWQIVAEEYRWRCLRIEPREIGCFRSAFRGKSRRRRALKVVTIRFEGYFTREKSKTKEKDREDEGDVDEDSSEESSYALWCQVCPEGECASDTTTFTGDGAIQTKGSDSDSLPIRLAAAQNEHARFFREAKAIWDELASWGDDLRVTRIRIDIFGSSLYDFVGPESCDDFLPDTLLDFSSLPELPLLTSVKQLHFHEVDRQEIHLWPTMVTCRIASSLPNLECLDTVDYDYRIGWPVARRSLRNALADQIAKLPSSLKTLHLCLEYGGINNHEVRPPILLRENLDCLSSSIRHISTYLTTLAIRVSYISTALFWDLDAALPVTSCAARWPHLRILDISTGFERPSGDYWFRPAANYPQHEMYDWSNDAEVYESDDDDPDGTIAERYRALGKWPSRRFLTRPEPALFDELAISMARAVAHMPKLEYLDFEFNASHQGCLKRSDRRHGGQHRKFHQYEGWGFYFRASNAARFASKYSKLYWFEHEPGLDRTDIERPRTEWVFQCPYGHLQWEEPEAAKALWRGKFPQIDFDVVALDGNGTSWERRRAGRLVPLLGAKFATQFPGREDLYKIPEGIK